MLRSWKWFVLASLPAAIAVACSFPDVTFLESSEADTNGGHIDGGEASADAATGADATSDAEALPPDVDPEGSNKDASTVGDAADQVDASACTSCDCDGDGFNRVDVDAGCNGGPGSNLPDCDDLIAAIHPGQGFVEDRWPENASKSVLPGDWDCSGTVTKQYGYGSTCGALTACGDGFRGEPACGETAEYLTCKDPLPLLGLTCSVGTSEPAGTRVQGCH